MFDFPLGAESNTTDPQNQDTDRTTVQQQSITHSDMMQESLEPPTIIIQMDEIQSPKIPPNAFNLFLNEQYKIIQEQNPLLSENSIMREIGRIWLMESNEFKEKYRRVAKELRNQFKTENPHYIYKPPPKTKAVHPIKVRVVRE